MAIVFQKPSTLTDAPLHYCPGCTHGIVHRLVAQALEELGVEGKTVGVASVGCSVMCYDYFTCDMVQAPHGRAQAVATGLKRARPDNVIFTYQGDGDLAAIGTAETVHAATRGENITVIFINNAIYGMTGGRWHHLPAGAGHPDHTLRPGYQHRRLPRKGLRNALHLGRRGLCPAGHRGLRQEREHRPQGHQKGLPEPD